MCNQTQKLFEAYKLLPIEFQENPHLPFFKECREQALVDAGEDVFKRRYTMHIKAYNAWLQMHQNAVNDGIEIWVVSAYRSYLHQANIIANKLVQGLLLTDVLRVSALPGFSEHHTGCALDLTSNEEKEILSEQFETTKAFTWLKKNAQRFGFYMSYPKNNSYGFIYEPWHWCYQAQ